jgi:hypothetical protein
MLATLVRQNLEQCPGKWADFERLDGCVLIEARDAEVMVTLEFARGALIVHAGNHGAPGVRISADSGTVLGLAALRIHGGIPSLRDRATWRLLAKLFTGAAKITGALRNLGTLLRVTRLFSICR